MLDSILTRFNIRTVDDLDMAISQYGTAMEALYEYYLCSGEMPYGIAKARTGDPAEWIYEQVSRHLGE